MALASPVQNFSPMARISIQEELANTEYELVKNQAIYVISSVAFAALALTAVYFAATISAYHVLPILASVPFVFTTAFVPLVYDPLVKSFEEKQLQCHLLKQAEIPPYSTKEEKIRVLTQMISAGAQNYYNLPLEEQEVVERGLFNIYSRCLMFQKAITACENRIATQKAHLAERKRTLEAELPMTAAEHTKMRMELTEIEERIHWLEEEDNPYAETMGLVKAKIMVAYCKFVLKNPTTQRDLDCFGEITPRSLKHRRVYRDNTYLYRNGGEQIDRDYFLRNSVEVIARRIFN